MTLAAEPIPLPADASWRSPLLMMPANKALATSVLASFGQLAKSSPVSIHPMVSRVVDKEMLSRLRRDQ